MQRRFDTCFHNVVTRIKPTCFFCGTELMFLSLNTNKCSFWKLNNRFLTMEMSEIRLFHVNKMATNFARLINNCIIIFNNNSEMTVKTVYIPIILLPNILWHYFNAAFLLKPLKSTAAYSVIDVTNEVKLTIQKLASQPSNSLNIINLTPKNRIPFSPIMFLLLYTPWTVCKLFNSISV